VHKNGAECECLAVEAAAAGGHLNCLKYFFNSFLFFYIYLFNFFFLYFLNFYLLYLNIIYF
jgi:hypothetical protein